MMDEKLPILPTVRKFDGHDWFSTHIYRRNLPHWELQGSTYFITMRVDQLVGTPFYNKPVAYAMVESLKKEDSQKYMLFAYVVMPDHLHLILKPIKGVKLPNLLKQLKGFSADRLNRILNRSGKFWQKESFDHLIRDDAGLREKWEYIKENPVKANLVKKAEEYQFSSFYSLNVE